MSTSHLQRTINRYRRELANREQRAEQALIDAYNAVLARLNPMLNELYRQISEKQANNEQVPLSWLYERNRLNALKLSITGQVDHFGSLALMTTGHMQAQGVALGGQAGLDLLRATVPPGMSWSFGMPDHSAIINLIGATQAGSPLSDLFNGFGQEAANAVSEALITGLSLGHNPRQVAPLVEQALNIPIRRARVIARSESIRAYRGANQEVFRANSRVVKQWRWTCAKSKRTCVACLAMDGTLHNLDEEMGSHPCCRCVPTPITADWSEILGPLGIDTSSLPDTRPVMQTGADWLESQDEATQRAVFGSDRAYELYTSGTPLHEFVQRTHDADWGSGIKVKSLKALVK